MSKHGLNRKEVSKLTFVEFNDDRATFRVNGSVLFQLFGDIDFSKININAFAFYSNPQ